MSWVERSGDRLPDVTWQQTLRRVRGEFEEMPCLKVTPDQARALFGLPGSACNGVLRHLKEEGFLSCGDDGSYMRITSEP